MTLKTNDEIAHFIEGYDKEAKALIRDVLRLTWSMRGAVTMNEAYALSLEQRDLIQNIIEENMEWTKETKLPFI